MQHIRGKKARKMNDHGRSGGSLTVPYIPELENACEKSFWEGDHRHQLGCRTPMVSCTIDEPFGIYHCIAFWTDPARATSSNPPSKSPICSDRGVKQTDSGFRMSLHETSVKNLPPHRIRLLGGRDSEATVGVAAYPFR